MIAVTSWMRLRRLWCAFITLAKTDTLQTDHGGFLEHDERFSIGHAYSQGHQSHHQKDDGDQSRSANVDSIMPLHVFVSLAP